MLKSGIYSIRNLVNGKIYIGSSVLIAQRFRDHRKRLKKGNHDNIHLQRSWNKHGEQNFEFSVLEHCEINVLLLREQAWLDKTKNKFNILKFAGNTLGRKMSLKTKLLIAKGVSKRTGPQNVWYGRSLPKSTLDKAAEYCRNHFKGEGNPFYGKRHTQKTKEILSSKLKGRKMPPSFLKKQAGNTRGAKEFLVKLPNGEQIKIRNLKKFCKENGFTYFAIYKAMKLNIPYCNFYFTGIGQRQTSTENGESPKTSAIMAETIDQLAKPSPQPIP